MRFKGDMSEMAHKPDVIGTRGRVVKNADILLPRLSIRLSHASSNHTRGTCKTSPDLLAGMPGGVLFAPPTDWPVSYELK